MNLHGRHYGPGFVGLRGRRRRILEGSSNDLSPHRADGCGLPSSSGSVAAAAAAGRAGSSG